MKRFDQKQTHWETGAVILQLLGLGLLLAGCQQAQPDVSQTQLDTTQTQLAEIDAKIEALESVVGESGTELSELSASRFNDQISLDARLDNLMKDIDALPQSLSKRCTAAFARQAQCDQTTIVERVVISADKMLVGELEQVWIDPPGVYVVARIDTGATSSSLHASNIVDFERDGKDWVRFDMMVNDIHAITIERQVIRHARVIQQADPGGSRRHVVEMRVRLGDVQDTFEFTLADRSHLENEMILGRNFLTDVTLIDVARQFIQPRHEPQQ